MRAGRSVGCPEQAPHGHRQQRAGQNGPGDQSFPHQAKSIRCLKPRGPHMIVHCKRRRSYELVHRHNIASALRTNAAGVH